MKPKNFPGRRMKRLIEAGIRALSVRRPQRPHRALNDAELQAVALAAAIRTKKDRRNRARLA